MSGCNGHSGLNRLTILQQIARNIGMNDDVIEKMGKRKNIPYSLLTIENMLFDYGIEPGDDLQEQAYKLYKAIDLHRSTGGL